MLRLFIAPSLGWGGFEGDLVEQKQAMHRSITLGFHEVYTPNDVNDPALSGGEWQGGYFINYPPVIVYLRSITGRVYRYFAPEAFELWHSDLNFFAMARTDLWQRFAKSRGFTVAAKLPSILGDCFLIIALFAFVAPRAGSGVGLAVASAFAFNPGVIIDSAHWGQHDSVWVSFLVVSLYWMHKGRIELSWVAYTLAGLTKPQASTFFFLILGLGLMRAPFRRVLLGGTLSLATFALVFLPFLLHGTFVESITAIVMSIFGGEPFVSNSALNFWWLTSLGAGAEVSDQIPLLGPLTARHLGMLMFLASSGLVLWRLRKNAENTATLYLAAGALFMSFYTFTTELHENHSMVLIPLCGLAIAGNPRVWWPFALLSLTLLMNMTLFDKYPLLWLVEAVGPLPIRELSLLTAALNLVALGLLSALFWRATSSATSNAGS